MLDQAIIQEIDHRQPTTTRRLHALQMAAYTQEAQLLGIRHFPPLQLSEAELAAQDVRYFSVLQGENLLAALGLEATADEASWLIASLVVAPSQQRQGWARRLIHEVLQRYPHHSFLVSTAVQNLPACQLYLASGFVPQHQTWAPLPKEANVGQICLQHFIRQPITPLG